MIFTSSADFQNCVDQTIILEGRVSMTPWQHLISFKQDLPIISYIDLPDNSQIVVYSRVSPPENTPLKLQGKIIRVVGSSKRPAKGDQKEEYVEYQMELEKILD